MKKSRYDDQRFGFDDNLTKQVKSGNRLSDVFKAGSNLLGGLQTHVSSRVKALFSIDDQSSSGRRRFLRDATALIASSVPRTGTAGSIALLLTACGQQKLSEIIDFNRRLEKGGRTIIKFQFPDGTKNPSPRLVKPPVGVKLINTQYGSANGNWSGEIEVDRSVVGPISLTFQADGYPDYTIENIPVTDTIPPTITSGITNVTIGDDVSSTSSKLVMSEPIATFQLLDSDGNDVSNQVQKLPENDGNSIVVTFSPDVTPGTRSYSLIVSDGTNTLATPMTLTTVDKKAPILLNPDSITNTTVSTGSTANFGLMYSEKLDTTKKPTVEIKDAAGNILSGVDVQVNGKGIAVKTGILPSTNQQLVMTISGVTDMAGNVTPSASYVFNIKDTLAPTLLATQIPTGRVSSPDSVIRLESSETLLALTVNINGQKTEYLRNQIPTLLKEGISITGKEGDNQITITAVDLNDNNTIAPITSAWIVDTESPSITGTVDYSATSGTASSADVALLSSESLDRVEMLTGLDGSGITFNPRANGTSITGTLSWDASVTPGLHTIHLRAYDVPAKNQQGLTTQHSTDIIMTLDVAGVTDTPTAVSEITGQNIVESGTSESYSITARDIDGPVSVTATLGGSPRTVTALPGDAYAISTPTNLSVGTYEIIFTVIGKKPDGTDGPSQQVRKTITVQDTTPPAKVSEVLTDEAGGGWIASLNVYDTIVLTEAVPNQVVDIHWVQVLPNGTEVQVPDNLTTSTTEIDNTNIMKITSKQNYSSGNFYLRFSILDTAGNSGSIKTAVFQQN